MGEQRGVYPPIVSEFVLLDLKSRRITSLAKFENYWGMTRISPDGQWLAYLEGANQENVEKVKVVVLQTRAPDQHLEIGTCHGTCGGLAWSPDSQMLAWWDQQGIWLSSPEKPTEILLASRMMPADFSETAWSPDSRYLFTQSSPALRGGVEEDTYGIIDTQTGRFGKLGNELFRAKKRNPAVWLDDGRLFILRDGATEGNLAPRGEIWRIDPTSEGLLALDQSFTIPVSPDTYPGWPVQLNDSRLAFVLWTRNESHVAESGLYTVSLNDLIPQHVSEPLPVGPIGFANWAPDGTVLMSVDLMHGSNETLLKFYIPTNDSWSPNLAELEGV
ncbi:MAG TPA: hypothetical protein VMP08_02820, partial [Anaerolineae bacterium]|nr:hypothetical protein [Anaerolineae bacterium]